MALPHNAVDLPFSYLDEKSYWKAFTYQKRFTADPLWEGQDVSLIFDGVMDMYREPKFAAYVYASQCDPEEDVVLKPVTYWTRGERNHGGVLPLIILTNCDEIELDFDGFPPRRFHPDRAAYPNLPHAPVIIRREDYPGPEFGHWGMGWQNVAFTGYIDGKAMKTVRYVADPLPQTLSVTPDSERIANGGFVRVMIRVLDQVGNTLPFLFEPVSVGVEGPARLAGPSLFSLKGGVAGFWLVATGEGKVSVTVSADALGETSISLEAVAVSVSSV
ncbi:hypothetical protein [Martelella mediterranea]|uniref:Uncharacterized protein n=1 Tax=Martelella mediterranea TaxID=293089 RepID=A0A4R3NS33_9HYPH|nr:hypothetical protein [Martelella mediterranea]TCT39074.1 hypothetical protein EDC90_101439 [Martelella mediterranea]